ncbi:uncharacterized protein TNCV_622681 [Trichonephila clavipes]|nr:uncharacterized protein TNCV_622681 [Trichonephila clavipes]
MVGVCPQPCSRLATAVIFIIVGVIQLLVGVILLRSEYANLLSGPDFLTASTPSGCGLVDDVVKSGIQVVIPLKACREEELKHVKSTKAWHYVGSSKVDSGSGGILFIWLNFKTRSIVDSPHVASRSCTAIQDMILQGSGEALANLSTSLILDLHSVTPHAFLQLQYPIGRIGLAGHIYNGAIPCSLILNSFPAYIASVCSPISCIVVAIIALSGRCFEVCREETLEKLEDSEKDYSYTWVFDSKDGSLKVINDLVRTTSVSYSLSTSKDSMLSKKGNVDRRKSVLSLKNIPSPLTMWRQKREKMLWDVKACQKQVVFDSSLKNPNFGGSLPEKLIPRIKPTSLIKKQDNLDKSKSFHFNDPDHSKMCRSILKRSSSGPDPRKMVFEERRPFHNYNLEVPDTIEGFFGKSTDLLKDNRENCDYDIKNKRIKVPERLKNNISTSACGHRIDKRTKINKKRQILDKDCENDIYPFDPVVSELKAEALKELKQKIEKILPGSSVAIIKLSDSSKEEIKPLLERENKPRFSIRNSSDSSDVFDETDADISRNKISSDRPLSSDESSLSAFRPERYSESSYHDSAFKNKVTDPGLTVIGKIRSKSLDLSRDEPEIKSKCQYKDETSTSSSSMKVDRSKNISNPSGSPKVELSGPKTVWMQAFPWPPSDQHMTIPGTKAEPDFIGKHNISTPSSNELRLGTTGVTNGNSLESVDCTLWGAWLVPVLEVTDF